MRRKYMLTLTAACLGICIVYVLSKGAFVAKMVENIIPKNKESSFMFTLGYNETLVESTIQERRLSKCINLTGDARECNHYMDCDSNVSTDQCQKRLPKCIVIGTFKSGTRELIDFLQLNPEVVIRKKPFYEISFYDHSFHKGLDWYKNEMPTSLPHQITIEKSPGYFISKEAPWRMFKTDPHLKLVLMVREPVARAMSHFTFESHVAEKQYGGDFRKCAFNPRRTEVNKHCFVIRYSTYNTSLARFLRYFRKEQILTIDALEFRNNPAHALNRVEDFLHIKRAITPEDFVWNDRKGYFCVRGLRNHHGACYDKTRGRKPHVIDVKLKEKLRTFFKPFNNNFFSLIGRTFDW